MLKRADGEMGETQRELFRPVDEVAGDLTRGLLLICDHADRLLPQEYGRLGLLDAAFERHIAYDIGAGPVTRELAKRLGVPAIMTRFSRLLIDPNRGEDDPTLIMRISDGAVVPGNRTVDADERMRRLTLFYRPYHDRIAAHIDEALARGIVPAVVSIHSFTANWRGYHRPWHAGILWDRDPRLPVPLIEGLAREAGLVVGDNEPYTGQLKGDTMYRHGTRRGLAHALVEIRQDLIAEEQGVSAWAQRLERVLNETMADPALRDIRHFGSYSDAAE
jgi:predicted N-formylglutamate amidohydrolase